MIRLPNGSSGVSVTIRPVVVGRLTACRRIQTRLEMLFLKPDFDLKKKYILLF